MLENGFSSHVVSPDRKPSQFKDDKFICLVQTWCFVFLTPQSSTSLACHSSAHTDTDTQGGGGEFRGCICISGRSSGSTPRGPWPVREGAQTGGILSPRAWVGSSSSQGGEGERRKWNYSLLLQVWGSKMEEESKAASVQVCAWVGGAGGAGGQAIHFSDKSGITFPTSASPWWISCSVTQISGDNSFSPLKHTRMHAPLPQRVVFPVARVWWVQRRRGFHRRCTYFAAAFSPMKAE